MDVFRVQCTNVILDGEHRTYFVLAGNCAEAEAKALKKMGAEVKEHKSRHYVYDVTLLGPLVR